MESDTKVLRAIDASPKPDEAVIRELKDLLVQAESGHLRGFAFAGNFRAAGDPECTLVRKAGTVNVGALVVALERIKLRLIGFVEDIDLDLEGDF